MRPKKFLNDFLCGLPVFLVYFPTQTLRLFEAMPRKKPALIDQDLSPDESELEYYDEMLERAKGLSISC